ncbi:MAG TPA: outer membrane lipid asymmetry maintenance protein MlaD [Caulobacterales bacterium]|nr:outer membrane lipid asymmetry maintenance protein MlaD [Caulobacterales bacterium]
MERWGETILGAIVVVVAVGFFAFAAAQAGQKARGDGYELTARFQRVDGIAAGSDVRVSGVKVGVVRSVSLDPSTYLAKLDFVVSPSVHIPDDSTARIASDGLLGGAYVAIEPGAGDALKPGGEIVNTQGAVDLLTVLASAAQNMGQQQKPQESTTP